MERNGGERDKRGGEEEEGWRGGGGGVERAGLRLSIILLRIVLSITFAI